MPIFEVSMPDGRKLAVTAPEGATADDAISYARLHHATPEKPADPPGFFENMGNLAVSGYENARDSLRVSMDDPEGAASVAAGMVKRQAATHQPEQLKEVKSSFQDEAQDWNDGNYLKSIGGALLEMGKQVVTNPKGMAYFGAEQAANMAAILAARYPGAIAGGKAGAALSGGNPLVTAGGAFLGGMATGGAAEYNLEAGSAALQGLMRRAGDAGVDISDAEAFKAFARNNPAAWSESVSEARDKGAWTTLVDQAMMGVSGRIASAPARQAQRQAASEIVGANTALLADKAVAKQIVARADEILKTQGLAPRVKHLGMASGNEMLGGMASEYAGQKAAYGEPDMNEVFLEGLGELVTGPVEALQTGREAIKANRYARQRGETPPATGDQSVDASRPDVPPFDPFAGDNRSAPSPEQPGGALAQPALTGEYLPAEAVLSGDVIPPDALPPGQRALPHPPIDGETVSDPALLARPALPAPEDGGPSERQIATARGLLNHSPKASPDLLMRLMRVDSTMAGMLFNDWRQKRESTALSNSVIPQGGTMPFRGAEQVMPEQPATPLPESGAPGAVVQPMAQPVAPTATADTVAAQSRLAAGQVKPFAPSQSEQKPAGEKGLSVGATPNTAEPITVRNGVVHVGDYPAQNYETGDDVTVPTGATPHQIARALRDAGAIGGRQRVFGLPAEAANDRPPVRRRPTSERRGDLVGAILRATAGDGIAASMAQTIVGDKANAATRVRGLFTRNGQQDLDDLASLLRENEGFDVRDGGHLAELIREQAAGNPVYSMERMEREAAAAAEAEHRSGVRERAAGLGIRTVARRFDQIEADVLAAEAARHRAEVERLDAGALAAYHAMVDEARTLGIDTEAVLDGIPDGLAPREAYEIAAGRLVPLIEARLFEINAELQLVADDNRRARQENYDVEGDGIDEQAPPGAAGEGTRTVRAQAGAGRNAAAPGQAEDGGTGGRARDADGFALAAYDQRELNAKAERAADESVARRAAADRERDAYALAGQSQPDPRQAPTGGQAGLFTADGRASRDAIHGDKIAGKPVAEMTEDRLRAIARGLSPTYGEAAVDKAKAELRRRTAKPMNQQTPADAGVSTSEYAPPKSVEEARRRWSSAEFGGPAPERGRFIAKHTKEMGASVGAGESSRPASSAPNLVAPNATIADPQAEGNDVAKEEQAVYAVSEPDKFTGDLFGHEIQGADRGNLDGSRSAAGGNVHPQAAAAVSVRADAEIPGAFTLTTNLVTVGKRKLPVKRVRSIEEAATAFAYLAGGAVERFDALVTNKDGKPLAIIGSFKGMLTQTSVFPGVIAQELARIEGAAHVWGAHNHPSGIPDLSNADQELSASIAKLLRGSGAEYRGLFAMAGAGAAGVKYSFVSAHGDMDSGTVGRSLPARHGVPIVERELVDTGVRLGSVSSPSAAKALVKDIAKDSPGILFLDAQNRAVRFVPFAPSDMGHLRTDGRLMRLFREASAANAGGAIVAMPDGKVSAGQYLNLKGALDSIDIRVLDGIEYESSGASPARSMAEQGRYDSPGLAFLSRQSGSRGNPLDTAALEAVISRVIAGSPGHYSRQTIVPVSLFSDLPGEILAKAKHEGYDEHGRHATGYKIPGITYDGKVYLVQENISSELEAEDTLLHERIHQIVHGNAKDPEGKALRQTLGRLYERMGAKSAIVRMAKEAGIDIAGPLAAMDKVAERNRPAFITEEFLAHAEGRRAYEKLPAKIVRAIREFYGQFRDWLRSSKFVRIAEALGAKLDDFTQADLAWTLKGIRQQEAKAGSKAIRFMTAWHGSPHDHDGFDSSKIGTGEGVHVYGFGHYFASRRDVAEWYKNKLSGLEVVVDGERLNQVFPATSTPEDAALSYARGRLLDALKYETDLSAENVASKAEKLAVESERDAGISTEADRLAAKAKQWGKLGGVMNDPAAIARESQIAAALRDIASKAKEGRVEVKKGRLYQVELAPEPDEYLDWDKPLSEQSEKVKAALEESGDLAEENLSDEELSGGGAAYKYLTSIMRSDKAASEYLRSIGIRGIKYLDGSSRNRPLKEIKAEFLAELPEDADTAEVMELVGTGRFSPKNEALIKALADDDWLGFDYPAQAISAALGNSLSNYDASPALLQAVSDAKDGGTHNYVIFSDADVKITAKESRGTAQGGAASPSVKAIQDVVSRFKSEFKGAAALDIRVVGSASEIPARYRPSPYAEGVFHDDAGLIYLVGSNLSRRGSADTVRAFQVLMHEAVGHYGLASMMGKRFDGLLKHVMSVARNARVTDDIYGPGDAEYATVEAVRLRYPDASDKEVAQEVMARMSESGAAGERFGYIRAVVRQWLRDTARALGIDLAVTTTELNDLVALASAYMRRGDNLAGDRAPSRLVAASARARGDSEDIAVPAKRMATTFDEARAEAKAFQGSDLKNIATGLIARVSRNSLDKMLSGKAVGKSETPVAHAIAVANLDALFERAIHGWSKPGANGDPNIVAIHRFFVPLQLDNGPRIVKMTVKETAQADKPNPLYTVEAVELNEKSPAAEWVGEIAEADGIDPRTTRSVGDVLSLAQRVEKFNSKGAGLESRARVAGDSGRQYSADVSPKGMESRSASGSQGPLWSSPDESRIDDVIYTMQDKNIDLKRVQQSIKDAIGNIRDDIDAYLQEELFHGRAAKATEEFLERELNPFIGEMKQRNIDMETLENFLWARHAAERNAQIAKINPGMPDGGSGLTNKQASDLMAGKDVLVDGKKIAGIPQDKLRSLNDLAKKIDAMTAGNRMLLELYELETPETIAAWKAAYQHYVPLHREDADAPWAGNGSGQGYSVKGASTKRATGSFRPVENILANIAMQRTRTITRGEKNRVAQAMYGLAQSAPNPEVWEVDKAPTIRVAKEMPIYMVMNNGVKIGEYTKLSEAEKAARMGANNDIYQTWGERVVEQIDPTFRNQPNVVFARFGGEDKFIVFNAHNPRAARMAESLKNLDADQIGNLMGEMARWTRYFAAINTQYNPVFGVVNLIRDVGTGMANIESTPLKGQQTKLFANALQALPAIFKAVRTDRKGGTPTGVWASLWEEFQEIGGKTGYRDMFRNSHEQHEALQNALDPTWWQRTYWGKTLTAGGLLAVPEQLFADKIGKPVFALLSDFNTMMENGVRLAAYKMALDMGMSKERAASLGKNLTVNFNRKGQITRQAGAMYAFFNASVQGTARIAETLHHGAKPGEMLGKAGKQIILGGLMLGAIQAMLLMAAGFDDDDPPEFVRDRALIFPIPFSDKRYLSLPLPLGFNILPAFGRIMTEFVLGGFKNPGKRLTHLFDVLLDSTNPLGNSTVLQTIAPTVIDPIAALAENKDWSGKTIYREDFSKTSPTPGFTRAKDTATSLSNGLAWLLNSASGGTDFKQGLLSPTPDQIDYLLGQLAGGVGRELGKVDQTIGSIFTGEELPTHKIPLIGRLYGQAGGRTGEGSRFYDNLRMMNEHKAEIQGLQKTGRAQQASAYIKENPESILFREADRTQRMVSELHKRKRELKAKDAPSAEIRKIEDRATEIMRRFNQRVAERSEQAKH